MHAVYATFNPIIHVNECKQNLYATLKRECVDTAFEEFKQTESFLVEFTAYI